MSHALHLHVIYEIPKQISIYNDDYKFIAYLYNILHKFGVDDEIMV